MRAGNRNFIIASVIALFAAAVPAQTATNLSLRLAAPYLDDVEKDVLTELNLARTQPAKYALFVKEHRDRFVNATDVKGPTGVIRTKEGTKAVDEAIDYLKKAKPIKPLSPSRGLSLAADDHVKDLGPSGGISHVGTDGSTIEVRINRHGKWEKTIGENIAMGPQNARYIVIQLIVDDGVADRGHRKNIFTDAFRTVGIAIGSHKKYPSMCVMDFAGSFTDGKGTTSSKPKR